MFNPTHDCQLRIMNLQIFSSKFHIRSSIRYLNPNLKTSTKETLDYSVETRPEWLDIFMGIHRYLRMRKVLQATISSTESINITTNTKFTKSLKYIHDNKSWERCYVLLKIFFFLPYSSSPGR